jgi:hypothetical protein
LDWDINAGYHSPAGRIETSTRSCHYTQERERERTEHIHNSHPQTTLMKSSNPRRDQMLEKKQKRQTPHQGHHHVEPFVVMPSHQCKPPDVVKNTESKQNKTCEASPHPQLNSLSRAWGATKLHTLKIVQHNGWWSSSQRCANPATFPLPKHPHPTPFIARERRA